MRTSWTRLAAVVITAGLAAGCYESEVPLDPAPQAEFDAGLAGAWRCLPVDGEPDELAATLTVARGQAARTFDATWDEPGSAPDRYEGFASHVDGVTYLNTRERRDGGALSAWFFVRHTLLRPNVLLIQVVDEPALAGAPKSAAGLREALRRRRDDPTLLTGGALCARVRR